MITNTGYLVGAIHYGNDNTTYNVTFPNGTTCSSFNISIIDDDMELRGDRSFRVTIVDMSLPFGTRLGDNITTEVVIVDNDSE